MDISNYPDGNIVEKGAQAYMLRGGNNFSEPYSSRTVYTCATDIASCTSLTAFDNTISPTAFGTGVTDAERDTLVAWQIGQNSKNESGTSYTIRPSAHGDVMHSRPVAINYGTDAAPKVVLFYGGNDGMLRAVNGNRDGGLGIGSAAPGQEMWSFLAPEFYPSIQRVYDNTIPVSFQGNTTCTPVDPATTCIEPQPKPYGFDGPVTAYRDSSNTWIYATMRRGGRAVYAFDVSDPTADPSLKWKLGCDSTGCSSGFDNIGQTWSAPKVLNAPGYNSGTKPLLIMGGGYDACEDSDTTSCTTPSKGSEIYVLDADSGALQKTLSLPAGRGVVSDVFVVPDPVTGLAKYAYVGDLGGNIWRVNIGNDAPSAWTVTQIASLGCDTVTSCFPNRKFQFMADVVLDNGKYDLMIGSGDREKPLTTYPNAYSVENYFFMVQDDPSDPDWLSSETSNCGSAVICLKSLVKIANSGASPTPATVAAHKGWYLELNPHEQVVTSAITIFGTTNFSTHTPAVYKTGECTGSLGTARVYNVSYVNAAGVYGETSRSSEIAGGGLAPSPVAGMVTLDGSTVAVPFCIGCDLRPPR
jgi:type IV pilus assembly protein PilY1